MKRLHRIVSRFILELESTPVSYTLWFSSFFALIIGRLAVESAVSLFENTSQQFILYEFMHTFFFFLFSFLLLWPLVAYFGNVTMKKASTVLLFGFLIILTPPLLDTWIAAGNQVWSFYKFDSLWGLLERYVTFFGDKPTIGITYGVRIEVALTILFIGIYTYIKSKKYTRAIISSIATYTILFILGTFPSWLTFIILGCNKNILSIKDFDVAGVFLSPATLLSQPTSELISSLNIKMSLIYAPLSLCLALLYLWKYNRNTYTSLLNNARFPQIFYHLGLFFLGMIFAHVFMEASISLTLFNILAIANLCIAIVFAWIASVIANDIFDTEIDKVSNVSRPLQKQDISLDDYKAFGIIFFTLSLLFSALVSLKCMFLLLAYQAFAWMYSAWVFRLKKFPVIATFFAGIASILIVILGYTSISIDSSLRNFPLSIIIYLLLSMTFFLPFKDLKDINGDKKDKIYTIPVLLGEQRGKLFIASCAFIMFLTSTFVLYIHSLFFVSIICGSISFWLIMKSTSNEASLWSYRKLPRYLVSLTFIYIVSILLYFY